MTTMVMVELVGGPGDGRRFEVSWSLVAIPSPLGLPLSPSLREMLMGFGRVETRRPEPGTEAIEYRWDGMVREDGVRRLLYCPPDR
jgi:hypothetical protein